MAEIPVSSPSPADAARTEAARQAIILAFTVLGLGVMIWAQRHAADPDFAKTQRMRAARGAERWWAKLAAWSWQRAEAARRLYESDRA